jgi:hypothetical protein
VTACVWVDEDARRVFGNSMPWSLLFVTAGALLHVFTFQYGLAGRWAFALFFPIGLCTYLHRRDAHVSPPERILTGRTVARLILITAAKLGMEGTARKWLAPIIVFADDAPAADDGEWFRSARRAAMQESFGSGHAA